MSEYYNVETHKIETIHQLRHSFPDKSLPDGRDYPELGRRLIHTPPKPEPLENHYISLGPVVEIDGRYEYTYIQNELTPSEPEVPQSVSRFQARMALHHFGMFEEAESFCTSEAAPLEVKEAWVSAQEFRRNSPTILSLKDSPLALTDEQLDEMFSFAGTVEA